MRWDIQPLPPPHPECGLRRPRATCTRQGMRTAARAWVGFLLPVLGLAGGAACPQPGDGCRSSQDCNADTLCQSGQCVPRCESDADCADQRACENGVCATTVRCTADTDCRCLELCTLGRCTLVDTFCGADQDCPLDTDCLGGLCTRPRAGCGFMGASSSSSSGSASSSSASSSSSAATSAASASSSSSSAASSSSSSSGGGADAGPCQGRDNGRLGDTCGGASECCNGLCLGASGFGICTQRCTSYADCNPPGFASRYACLDITPSDRLCVGSDYEEACLSADQCVGQVCLAGRGTNGCSWRCTTHADCPGGSACGPIPVDTGTGMSVIYACARIGNGCTVDGSTGLNDCLSGTCLVDGTNGYCSVFCNPTVAQPCPNAFACVEVQSGFPPVCVLNP